MFINFSIASTHLPPELGVYQCIMGNNPDICDQRIEVVYGEAEAPSAIKISYVGYCGEQGPYLYYCTESICEDQFIRITLMNQSEYLWENVPYGFKCSMSKKSY